MELNKNLKTIRKRWRMDQQQIADLMEVTRGMWSQYERGGSQPSIVFMVKLEDLTGHSVKKLYSEEIVKEDLPLDPLKEPITRPSKINPEIEQAINRRLKELTDLNILLRTVAEHDEDIRTLKEKFQD